MRKFLTSLFFGSLLLLSVPLSVSAQSADGIPGIPSYSQALAFSQDYFADASDYTILPDPDSGYVIVYQITDGYNPLEVQTALDAFLATFNTTNIDLRSQVSPISRDLIQGQSYRLEIDLFGVENFSQYQSQMTGDLLVPVVVQFDYLRNGFDRTTQDFSQSTTLRIDTSGNGSVIIPDFLFRQSGDWRYRMISDPNGLYEPLRSGTRANNTSSWENFVVISPTDPPVTDPERWPLISDFDSYGRGYANESTGGETCEVFRGWACDTRPGTPVTRIDVLVDGVQYDSFYTSITANGLINPWWSNIQRYGYNPGCPAQPGNPYRFAWVTPAALKDGVSRTVRLRATRADGHSEFIVSSEWDGGRINRFELQCTPEVNIVDLASQIGLTPTQQVNIPFRVPGTQVTNWGDIATGGSFEVELQFDHGSDGYNPGSTVDFSVVRTLSALASGATVNAPFGNITNSVAGQWRVRMLTDESRTVEPITYGQRGNNRTSWQNYTVAPVDTVATVPAPTCQLVASNTSITEGDTAVLTWNANNSISSAVISGGVGSVNSAVGTVGENVTPSNNTTYVMTVENSDGVTNDCQVTIAVSPLPVLDLTVEVNNTTTYTAPSVISTLSPGDRVDVDWTATNVERCTKSFVLGDAVSGSETFDPVMVQPGSSQAYTVRCVNSNGNSVQRTISITVPSFSINLSVADNLIRIGETVAVDYDIVFPAGTTYPIECEFLGFLSGNLTTDVTVSNTVKSQPIENASVAMLRCVEPLTGFTLDSNKVLVEVIPTFQEI